jgi:hypothetical protein
MAQPSVVIVGHVCIDHNRSEHSTYASWGSSALYMAQVFKQRYNAPTTVLTSYGPDITPYLPHVTLVPRQPPQERTLIYQNDTSAKDGKRVQHCHNTEVATPPVLTPALVRLLAQADIVVLAVLLPNYDLTYVQELLIHVRPDALKMLCPQGYFREIDDDGLVYSRPFTDAEAFMREFDITVYSEEDYPEAFATAQAWKRSVSSTQIVITQSDQGASIVHADHVERIATVPIPREEIIDSVGCGDTFAAALAYAYYASHDLPGAIAAAHQIAAQKLRSAPQDY